jgi:hypothetical protein
MTSPAFSDDLVALYRENLAADVISALSDAAKIPLRQAMDLYYRSALSSQIEQGLYGIDNLDPKTLADDLLAHHPPP